MPKRLNSEQRERSYAKLEKSALGKLAFLSDRDLEVIQSPDHFRILVYDVRLPNGRWSVQVDTGQEAHRMLQLMVPSILDRTLVYAVKGIRQALVPRSRYDDLFLQPRAVHP